MSVQNCATDFGCSSLLCFCANIPSSWLHSTGKLKISGRRLHVYFLACEYQKFTSRTPYVVFLPNEDTYLFFLISSTWTLRCQIICPTSVFWPLGVQNKTRVTQNVPFSWSRARKPALWRWLKTFNMNLRLFPDLWVSKIAKDKEHVLVSLPLGTYVGSLYIFSSKTYQKGS